MHVDAKHETGRHAVLLVAEEGLDGGETGVAGADAVVALSLQRLEEAEQHRDREVLDRQRAGPDIKSRRDMQDEQLEAVGVALHGVAAEPALVRQMVAQEGRHMPSLPT